MRQNLFSREMKMARAWINRENVCQTRDTQVKKKIKEEEMIRVINLPPVKRCEFFATGVFYARDRAAAGHVSSINLYFRASSCEADADNTTRRVHIAREETATYTLESNSTITSA